MRPARAEPVQSSLSSEWVPGHRILGEMGREGVGLRQLEFCRGPIEGVDIHQATLVFLSRCSLTSEEVRSYYLSGGPEAHESTGIIFVETQRAQRLQETEMWAQLCPSAKGAILLYNRHPSLQSDAGKSHLSHPSVPALSLQL